MRSVENECGARNTFGYYDKIAKEIVLKHPCSKKIDIEEAYRWIDLAGNLKKFSIGIGSIENFVIDNSTDGQYSTARSVIKQNIFPNMYADNALLQQILNKLQDKKELRSFLLKCFIFSEDQESFALLLRTIKNLSGSLVYLDLTGCYFTDEQLIDLADVVTKTHIAHMIWPEPRMSQMVLEHVVEKFKANKSFVLLRGVPLELSKIAADNRTWLFDLGRRPSIIGDEEIALLKEYKNSVRLVIAHEKQVLWDMEKAIEAAMA